MALATALLPPACDAVDDYDKYEQEFYGSKAPTPNMIRGKIRKFLTATGMKVGAMRDVDHHGLINSEIYGECMGGVCASDRCARLCGQLSGGYPSRGSSSVHPLPSARSPMR
jgi:hypothetical protein